MDWDHRIATLSAWGKAVAKKDWTAHLSAVMSSNPWFDQINIELAIEGIAKLLDERKLYQWSSSYQQRIDKSKTVGIIMAGNIPLVGIHDFVCCYLSGHNVLIKPSSQDMVLLQLFLEELKELDVQFSERINVVSELKAQMLDAVIATGSDNTARYFRYLFENKPTIIRTNRTSLAILNGEEKIPQLSALGVDIFSYYGRGCRNVSKIIVPNNYDFGSFFKANQQHQRLLDNAKYSNNYNYQKAKLSVQNIDYIDSGYCLLINSDQLGSPLATIYYQYYQDEGDLDQILEHQSNKIQCVASCDGWFDGSINFGELQRPDLWDYADNIDTLDFLLNL